jgi:hypothetical protein
MMNLDKVFVVDIECDGLLDTLTKLHVLSACYYSENNKWEIISTNDSARIQNLVGNPDNVIVGHNFIGYDKPALEKLGYEFKAQVIDTLGLSWYLYNEHLKHGLESWGERFGVPKPEIEDWENLTYEDYKHRCEEDVKINTNLWVKMLSLLTELYEDRNTIISVIKYFTFKMECLRYQEENKVLIDIEKCKENLGILESIIEEKNEQLKKVMPKVPKYSVRKKPANPFKKDGSLSAAGERWFDLLEKANLPSDYDGELKEVVKYDEPNPASDQQMKDYLTSLGWTPKFFKDGANGKVPQLRDDDKNLCPNIQKLIAIKPELEALDGLSVASHRAGYLKAFLKYADKDGYAIARCNGFAKTIRLKHSNPFVNLPKPTAQYGEYVRSVMIAPPGKVLIGSDVSSLEDKTKQIAIYSYDPDYVEQMNVKGWDAHLDIGERSGLLNSEEIKFFKWFKSKDKKQEDCPEIYLNFSEEDMSKEYVRLSKKRAVAKTVNYAATYGAGASKISESAGIQLREAKNVLETYWERNWSVKQYAEDRETKQVDGKTWVYNPYSKLWLYLTSEHIKFSACNQNAGVKMFDLWIYFMINEGLKPIAQFHDEVLLCVDEDKAEWAEKTLHKCMENVNNLLGYPIKLEVDVQVGRTYADVH